MGERSYKVLVGKPKGRRPLEHPGIDGKIKLNCILEKYDGGRHELDQSG
jgi:hypothetical protein